MGAPFTEEVTSPIKKISDEMFPERKQSGSKAGLEVRKIWDRVLLLIHPDCVTLGKLTSCLQQLPKTLSCKARLIHLDSGSFLTGIYL